MSTAPIKIVELAGPQLLGELINWGLMGALSVQVYLYSTLFPEDSFSLRLLVYGIFVFEWIQTVLITQTSFNVFAENFGDVSNLLLFHNTWFSVPVMCGIVSATVQIFYARRIWTLSKSSIFAGVICVLALTQGSAAIASGILLHDVHSAAEQATTTPAVATWLGGSALVDILIAVSMTILLLKTKSGLRHSDTMVNKLVRLVIESGTITASIAIVDVVMFSSLPATTYHECPALALAKLYANMMVTSLNNRAFIQRGRGNNVVTVTMQNESAIARAFMPQYGTGSEMDGRTTGTETMVRVDVMKETDREASTGTITDVNSDYPMKDYAKGSMSESMV